jgi:hypothetical protein
LDGIEDETVLLQQTREGYVRLAFERVSHVQRVGRCHSATEHWDDRGLFEGFTKRSNRESARHSRLVTERGAPRAHPIGELAPGIIVVAGIDLTAGKYDGSAEEIRATVSLDTKEFHAIRRFPHDDYSRSGSRSYRRRIVIEAKHSK